MAPAFLSRERVALTQLLSENVSSFAPLLPSFLQLWPLFPRLAAPLTSAQMHVVLPLPPYIPSLITDTQVPSPQDAIRCPAKCQACSRVGIFLRLPLFHHPSPCSWSSSLLDLGPPGFCFTTVFHASEEINAPKLSPHLKHLPSLVSETLYSQSPFLLLAFLLPFMGDPGTAKPMPALPLIPSTCPGRDEMLSLSRLP